MTLTSRAARATEVSVPQRDERPALPVIIEPSTSTFSSRVSSSGFTFTSDAPQIFELLEVHGAVLLRGFAIPDATAFAGALSELTSVDGCELTSVEDYFPAEYGRDSQYRVDNSSTTLWPTNRLRRTGGYLQPEVVPHTECFYAMKQPRVCAFFCERTAWLGGETALFDGPAAINALPSPLRSKLGRPAAVRRLHTLSRLQDRHGDSVLSDSLPCLAAETDTTWRLVDGDAGESFVELTFQRVVASASPPPPLTAHARPHDAAPAGRTSCRQVCFNFGELSQLPGPRHALLHGLLRRGLFAGRKWAVHRMLWKLVLCEPYGIVRMLLSALDSLPGWLTRPWCMLRALTDDRCVAKARAKLAGAGKRRERRAGLTLMEQLSQREAEQMAEKLAEHVAAVRWQSGDVLLIDNSRILHDGLPGFGPFRKLHVALLA